MPLFTSLVAPTKMVTVKCFIIHVTVHYILLTQFSTNTDSNPGALFCFPVEAHRQGMLRPRDRGFMDLSRNTVDAP